jgi:hypothetical protein
MRLTAITGTIVAALLSMSIAAPAFAATAVDFTVVVADSTGVPVSGLTVVAEQVVDGTEVPSDPAPHAAATKVAGQYVFTGSSQLRSGASYTLRVVVPAGSPSEYSQYLGGSMTVSQARTFTAGTGIGAVSSVSMSLAPGGSIRGIVSSPTGKPVSGATVEAFYYDGSDWTDEVNVSTNASGEYDFASLEPGSYKLGFDAPGDMYVPVFSGGGSDLDSATGTWVTAGQASLLDISFASYPGAILGSAQLEAWNYSNAPMVGASVGAVPVTQLDGNGNAASGDVTRIVYGTNTDSKGVWSITGLPAGNYAVEVIPRYAVQIGGYIGSGASIAGARVFRVGNGLIDAGDNYFRSLQAAGSFSTVLYTPGGTARASGVQVSLQSQLIPTTQFSGTTDSQGAVTLGLQGGKPIIPNGPYSLTMIDPQRRYEPLRMSITIGNYENGLGYDMYPLQSQPGFSVLPTIAQTATEVGTQYTVTATDARPDALLSYQWLRDGHPIYGATGSTYQSRLSDVGTQLSVRVEASSFGFSSVYGTAFVAGVVTVTDVAPTLISPPSISPSSDASVHAGTVLRVAAGVWDTPGVVFSYRWLEDGAVIPGASTNSFQVSAGDIGHHFSATVTAAVPGYSSSEPAGTNAVSPTAGPATTPVAPMMVTTSTNGLTAGSTRYTVATGQWTGLNPEFHYSWKLGGTEVGTDSPSYIASGSPSDLAQALTVTVDAIVAGFEPGSATVTARNSTIALVPLSQPFATFTSDESGTVAATSASSVEVGSTLTIHPGTWAPASAGDTLTFTYQWMRATDWSSAAPIAGAMAVTYTPTVSDLGSQLSFVETAHSTLWQGATSAVIATGLVAMAPGLSSLTSTISVPDQSNSGVSITPTLVGAWANTALSYQWYGCVAPTCSGSSPVRSFTSIDGATSLSYVPPLATTDSRVYIAVTAKRFGSVATELRSDIIDVVGGILTLPYPPVLQNYVFSNVQVGRGVTFGGFSPIAGGDADGYSMSWQVCSADCGSQDADWHAPDGPTQYGSGDYNNSFTPSAADWANDAGYVRAAEVATKASYTSATAYSAIQHIDIGILQYVYDPTRHFDATADTWSVVPGLGDTTVPDSVETVQWYVGDRPQPMNDTDSYTPTAADAGQAIYAIDSFSAPGYKPTSYNISAVNGSVAGVTALPTSVVGNTFGQPITLSNPIPWDLPDADENVWTMRYDWLDQTQGHTDYVTSMPFLNPQPSAIGHVFEVLISATSPEYPELQTTATATFILLAGGQLSPTTEPSVSWIGSLAEGTTLTANVPEYAPSGVSTAIDWQTSRDDTNWTNILGATGLSYTLTAADQGEWVRAAITASAPGYTTSTSYSESNQADLGDAIRELTEPAITGDAGVDGMLSADPGVWPNGVLIRLQWLLNGNPVPGATSDSYSPLPADLGNEISLEVIASAPGLANRTAESNRMTVHLASAPIASTNPAVSGAGTSTSPLTVSSGGWSVAGLEFTYQWSDQTGPIAGATTNSLVLPVGDLRADVFVTVTATRYGYADGQAIAH